MKIGTGAAIGMAVVGVVQIWRWIDAPPPAPKPVTVTISYQKPGDAELVERAVQVFATACPDLFGRFRRDVEWIEAEVSDTIVAPYLEEQKGWRRNVYLRIKIADDARSTPREWRAAYQTLHYWLGAGWDPGIRSQKDQSQLVCGFPPGDGSDVFTPVPALAFLDEAVKAEPAPNKGNEDLGLPDWARGIEIKHATSEEKQLIARALPIFAGVCPKLIGEHLVDVTAITARIDRDPNDLDAARGWRSTAWLYFDIADNPTTIPPEKAELLSWGGTYELGAGTTTGVLARGLGSQWLCGMPENLSYPIAPVPELAFLDALN